MVAGEVSVGSNSVVKVASSGIWKMVADWVIVSRHTCMVGCKSSARSVDAWGKEIEFSGVRLSLVRSVG